MQYQPKATDNSRTNWSYYRHDGGGQLLSVRIDDGRDRTVTYHNDLNGQTVRRVERDGDTSRGDPH
ncbi:MAG TPA: hypothetical protein VEZ48_00140, partial [Sphingomonadaceae bacterium]|nr:hypothetical protein [Sphingomonadaceae bacterium]